MKHSLILSVAAISAMFLATSCEQEFLPFKGKAIYVGEKYTIQVNSSSAHLTFAAEDDFYVDLKGSTGDLWGRHVGKTGITVADEDHSAVFYITVKPKLTYFPEPNEDFYLTKEEVEKKFGTPESQPNGGTIYNYPKYHPNAALQIAFGSDGIVSSYTIMIPAAKAAGMDLDGFLNERYEYYKEVEGKPFWGDALDKKKANFGVTHFTSGDYEIISYVQSTPLQQL